MLFAGGISFNDPIFSEALGPVNNPFHAKGWVKTKCGDGVGSAWSPELEEVRADVTTFIESPGPMWEVVTPEEDIDIEIRVEEPIETALNESRCSDMVEQVSYDSTDYSSQEIFL